MVLLTSSDNHEIRTEKDVIGRSGLFRNLMAIDDEYENMAIPPPNVNGAILKMVLEFCKHYRNDPLPEPFQDVHETRRRQLNMSEWDKNYINVDQETLFEAIIAAHYLDIKDLLDVGCKKVADMIKGMTPEEMRQFFGIVNDFTPEEEEQIRRENEWAMDRY